MVSVGVSRMGKTSVVFVEPGAKINSQYHCEKVLGQGLLPDIRVEMGVSGSSWKVRNSLSPEFVEHLTQLHRQ